MAMSDLRIMNAMVDRQIIIEPFDRASLSTSSYDVRLGPYFYREQKPHLAHNIFNIYDQSQVKKVFGECEKAQAAHTILGRSRCEDINLDPEARIILIAPGEVILGHTDEFIGGREKFTSMMKARSSLGRSFITVCKCAGWGDVGYFNRWTMEITNVSQHYSIPLIVGSRIAQIVFMETGLIIDRNYADDGAYQTSDDLAKIMREWEPSMMLPRNRP